MTSTLPQTTKSAESVGTMDVDNSGTPPAAAVIGDELRNAGFRWGDDASSSASSATLQGPQKTRRRRSPFPARTLAPTTYRHPSTRQFADFTQAVQAAINAEKFTSRFGMWDEAPAGAKLNLLRGVLADPRFAAQFELLPEKCAVFSLALQREYAV